MCLRYSCHSPRTEVSVTRDPLDLRRRGRPSRPPRQPQRPARRAARTRSPRRPGARCSPTGPTGNPLFHTPLGHRVVVARVAERRPHELGPAGALGQHLAHGEAVHDLLQHEPGEDGEYLQGDPVAELVHRIEHLRRFQPVPARHRAHAGFFVLVAARIGLHHGEAHVAAAFAADDHAALLLQAVEAEGREEQMQQARVVGVLHVLEVELQLLGRIWL